MVQRVLLPEHDGDAVSGDNAPHVAHTLVARTAQQHQEQQRDATHIPVTAAAEGGAGEVSDPSSGRGSSDNAAATGVETRARRQTHRMVPKVANTEYILCCGV